MDPHRNDASIGGRSSTSHRLPTKSPLTGKKRGPKKGGKRQEYTKDMWYGLCADYQAIPKERRPTQSEFLIQRGLMQENASSKSRQVSFSNYLRLFRQGTLKPASNKRFKESTYAAMDQRLADYLRQRQIENTGKDDGPIGVSWAHLKDLLGEWAEEMKEDDPKYEHFKASPGFIDNVMSRHGLKRIRLDRDAGNQNEAVGPVNGPVDQVPPDAKVDDAFDVLRRYYRGIGSQQDLRMIEMLESRERCLRVMKQPTTSQTVLPDFFAPTTATL